MWTKSRLATRKHMLIERIPITRPGHVNLRSITMPIPSLLTTGSRSWLNVRTVSMLADLAVLVPSRGRPENLARLINAVHATSRGRTHVIAGVDQDDPRHRDYMALKKTILEPGDDIVTSNQRRNLVDWTNLLARTCKIR